MKLLRTASLSLHAEHNRVLPMRKEEYSVFLADVKERGIKEELKLLPGRKQLLGTQLAEMAVTSPVPNSIPRTQGKKAVMIAGQRSIGGGNNQTDHLGSYSFAWWTNDVDRNRKRHWPGAPPDTFGAFGHGGIRATVVIPSRDIVVSWNGAKIKSRDMENRALKLLVEAITKENKQ